MFWTCFNVDMFQHPPPPSKKGHAQTMLDYPQSFHRLQFKLGIQFQLKILKPNFGGAAGMNL